MPILPPDAGGVVMAIVAWPSTIVLSCSDAGRLHQSHGCFRERTLESLLAQELKEYSCPPHGRSSLGKLDIATGHDHFSFRLLLVRLSRQFCDCNYGPADEQG